MHQPLVLGIGDIFAFKDYILQFEGPSKWKEDWQMYFKTEKQSSSYYEETIQHWWVYTTKKLDVESAILN